MNFISNWKVRHLPWNTWFFIAPNQSTATLVFWRWWSFTFRDNRCTPSAREWWSSIGNITEMSTRQLRRLLWKKKKKSEAYYINSCSRQLKHVLKGNVNECTRYEATLSYNNYLHLFISFKLYFWSRFPPSFNTSWNTSEIQYWLIVEQFLKINK